MKVAFINSLYAPHEIGGAEKAVRTLAEELVFAGHQAIVITLAPDGVRKIDTLNGVKIYYEPLANFGFMHGATPLPKWQKLLWYIVDAYNPMMRRRIERILREENPDVVEANNLQGFSVSAWQAAKNLNIPVVQVLHDYYLGCINSTMYTQGCNCDTQCFHCKVLSIPRRQLSVIPHSVSSVSRRTLQRIQSTGTFKSLKNISFGSSGIQLKDLLGTSERSIHKAGEPLIIGFLGRLEPLKGVSVLLEAISRMEQGKVRLLVAGGGNPSYLEEMKATYSSANIEFLGIVNPAVLFSQIHMLIVPSVWEDPLPRVIAESQASGIPVAISKLGGMPEIVKDGLTGYYFEANNPDAICTLLNRLHKENFPTAEQIAACRARVPYFSVEDVFKRHLGLWQEAAITRAKQ